ncbi:GPI-anchor transamidase subunit 8 (GPI8) [Trypanosoma brucei brucei TREU927]|uniref:GPI-anchor transamidase subunit 8 (GPI8) n=1 Tax=Trypanosoma brucei brucei (strain 927/4 GUTat10.1) TaxID=185431 RepID=Q388L3_TRYB2|nr:GPI-anchor transamidase subunit 8 (GPI8) [Trypanosoma brucei brucei TREU927]EAN78757.1 GPI-anchor transamidase subunit 8 (GPI8) [Trypanosoma brucei brucei TREU927]
MLPMLLWLVANLFLAPAAEGFHGMNKTNTWAVILSSSRYFFNLRHTTNALAMYHLCRKHGMDDDHILVFLSDSYACDPRKPNPATIYGAPAQAEQPNLYGCNIRVDYASYDVGVRRFLGVLQGRYDENTPPSRRLDTDENSNIIIYAAGHSAEKFFKFQDSEFMSSTDIADTLMMMWEQRRYRKLVFLVDTCRALSLCLEIKAPNVVCLASSEAHLDSYSHHLDPPSGFTVITRWTFEFLEVLKDSKCRPENGEVTLLQKSFYDFNYGPERLSLPQPLSEPAHFDAVNRPNAVREWKMDEFFCEQDRDKIPVELRYDLF